MAKLDKSDADADESLLRAIMVPSYKGGPREEDVQKYMEENNLKNLEELVKKYDEVVNPKTSKPKAAPNLIREILEKTRKQGKLKAKGGSVKKYAKGGGVRKVQ